MQHDASLIEPTSTAATRGTEPEVIAGISSGDLSPDQPMSFHTGEAGMGYARIAMLLAAGLAIGYGAARLWQSTR